MLSSSGLRDALGERDLRFDRETGEVRERLLLRPELAAYESALRRRVGRLASIADPRLVPVEAVEHDEVTRRVAVVSRHVSGVRLQHLLRTAREHEIVPDFTVALYVTAEVLIAAQAFQALSGLPHGAISPERIVVTHEGEVLLADFAFVEVLEAARFTPARLWREFGIGSWLGEPFSFAGDVRQCALAGIALMLGRPLAQDAPDHFEALLAEVEEAAMIRGGRLFADPVIGWLRRAIAAGTPDGFDAAEDAAPACAALLTDRERAVAPSGFVQFLAELDAPPAPAPPIDEPTDVLAPDPLLVDATASVTDDEVTAGAFADLPAYEPLGVPGPEFAPVTDAELSIGDGLPSFAEFPTDLTGGSEPYPDFVTSGEPDLPASVPPVADAVAAQAGVWAPPAKAAIEVTPDSGPRVVSPSPFAIAQATPRALAPAPALPLQTSVPPPVTVIPAPSIQPLPAPLPAAAPAPATIVPAPAASPIRLKSESPSPIRLKNPTPPHRSGSTTLRLDLSEHSDPADVPEDESSGAGWNIPWKYVAAAVLVLATGLAAATMDWRSSTPVKASPAEKAVEAPPRPPATTGSIEVLSNTPGSKVLVDGKLRGETPLTIDELKPGRHVVVVRAPNGNVRRTVTVKVGETAKLDLAVYSGWIVVSAPIELKVLENGKVIGTAGEGPIVLSAGHHTIEVASQALDYRSSHAVDIQPGEERRLELNPMGLANLNAVPWAEIWLDGAKLGDTPLGNVPVPLGTREFVFRNPQFGERKISTTITGSTPAQISVDFTK